MQVIQYLCSSQHSNILKRGLSVVTESGSLNCTDLDASSQLIDYQCRKCVAL